MNSVRMEPWICNSKDGIIVRFYIQPGASRTEIVGVHGEGKDARLKIRISAPPVDGAANEELLRFLKKQTGLSLSQIQLIRGATARTKDVLFVGSTDIGPLIAAFTTASSKP